MRGVEGKRPGISELLSANRGRERLVRGPDQAGRDEPPGREHCPARAPLRQRCRAAASSADVSRAGSASGRTYWR